MHRNDSIIDCCLTRVNNFANVKWKREKFQQYSLTCTNCLKQKREWEILCCILIINIYEVSHVHVQDHDQCQCDDLLKRVGRTYLCTVDNFNVLFCKLMAAAVSIISTIGAGYTIGYSAILLPQLQSNSSEIRISEEEGSWVASLTAFAMAPGCLLSGIIMQKYGRKFAQNFLCLPVVFGWLSIYLAKSLTPMMLGRFLTGKRNYVHAFD